MNKKIKKKGMLPPKPLHRKALLLLLSPYPPSMFSELLGFDKRGLLWHAFGRVSLMMQVLSLDLFLTHCARLGFNFSIFLKELFTISEVSEASEFDPGND